MEEETPSLPGLRRRGEQSGEKLSLAGEDGRSLQGAPKKPALLVHQRLEDIPQEDARGGLSSDWWKGHAQAR